jgi:heat shock protein HslJ
MGWRYQTGAMTAVTRFTTAAAVAVAVGAVFVGGCSSGPEPYSLNGTSWQLTSIASMDDAQGSTPVPDPGKFTVKFGTDGRAAFQLDCNTGSGSFEAKPGADGTSGSLTFGPVATTLMGCPAPSLDQQVGAALPQVTSYLVKNSQLNMSLLADGGVLTWKPL